MTYWVIVDKPPSNAVDAWEALYEAFGTEPFSKTQGLAVLMKRYTGLAGSNLERVFDGFANEGSLGTSERDF